LTASMSANITPSIKSLTATAGSRESKTPARWPCSTSATRRGRRGRRLSGCGDGHGQFQCRILGLDVDGVGERGHGVEPVFQQRVHELTAVGEVHVHRSPRPPGSGGDVVD
jgi:hypothetical protein